MAEEKKGFFSRLVAGLEKTRKAVVYGLDDLFNGPGEVDDEFFDELEEILITGDVGVRATEEILEELREAVEAQHVRARIACRDLLIDSIKSRMNLGENAYDFEKRVLLAGADTFRAAAIEQLEAWSQRAGVEMVKSSAGADPAAVVFDACQAARARRTDLLICDTAGRLHNKKNLMEELRKIDRVLQRELPDYRRETLLVLDGTTGQNAIEQAKEFGDICEISGVALTKLDGSAKGGVAIAIQAELKLPVKFIGVGERI